MEVEACEASTALILMIQKDTSLYKHELTQRHLSHTVEGNFLCVGRLQILRGNCLVFIPNLRDEIIILCLRIYLKKVSLKNCAHNRLSSPQHDIPEIFTIIKEYLNIEYFRTYIYL